MMLSKEEIIANARDNKDYTGVYFLIRSSQIVYIGSSFRIGKRISCLYSQIKFDYYSFVEVKTNRVDLLRSVEAEYILKYKPIHNKTIPGNSRYAPINKGLSKELLIINMKHKIKILEENGFELIKYENKYNGFGSPESWFVHKNIKSKINKCLMRNFVRLETMQRNYIELKTQLNEY